MNSPWLSVEEDGEGTTRVLVEERHLLDFPKFMKDVIDAKIGLEKGVFKINIAERQGGTDLNKILNIVKKYYKTLRSQTKLTSTGKWKTVHCYPEVQMQTFNFSRAKDEQLYGYLNSLRTSGDIKKDRDAFLRNVESPEIFLNESTCCLQVLSRSVDELVNHYWDQIASIAAGAQPITYGAGIPVEGEGITFSTNFTLSKLQTILDLCPISYPGIQQPFLYVGSEHATFPWHIEDSALFSTNILHFGAPCLWFFIPPHYYKKFMEQIQFFPLDISQTSCINALGHKYILASKDFLLKFGIPVHTVVQRENDILVIYPFAAHSGFKCGRNLQVAVNFADPWWIEPAILAPTCACFVSQIHLDLKEFIAVAKHHLLQDYLNKNNFNLYKELEKNEFVCKLGILPSLSSDKKSNKETNTSLVSTPAKTEAAARDQASQEQVADKSVDQPKFSDARCPIKCPSINCKKAFQGGRCKLPRMEQHIKKEHGSDQELIVKLHHMYPSKVLPKLKGSVCSVCGEFISGSSYHMGRHLEKVHLK